MITSASFVPGLVWTQEVSSYLILSTTICGKYSYVTHHTNESPVFREVVTYLSKGKLGSVRYKGLILTH